jgi:hypothetical protein
MGATGEVMMGATIEAPWLLNGGHGASLNDDQRRRRRHDGVAAMAAMAAMATAAAACARHEGHLAAGLSLHLLFCHSGSDLEHHQPRALHHIEDPQLGDDAVHHALTRERQRAGSPHTPTADDASTRHGGAGTAAAAAAGTGTESTHITSHQPANHPNIDDRTPGARHTVVVTLPTHASQDGEGQARSPGIPSGRQGVEG